MITSATRYHLVVQTQVKVEEAQLKISLHGPMVHWMTDQKLSKNHGDLMFPDKVIATQSSKKALTQGNISTFHELYIPSNSVKLQKSTITLESKILKHTFSLLLQIYWSNN